MEVKINGIYKHFKGNLYRVENIAIDSETLEEVVVYRALYGEQKLWVRKKSNFLERVNKNGQEYRFELQEEK
ncbi:MAG: DUF1653 domain-containing protein [Clostridia bacterium]|nr:DUF1653 domain-containing protein [Clostridia bacterium]